MTLRGWLGVKQQVSIYLQYFSADPHTRLRPVSVTYLMAASNPPWKPLAQSVACARVCRGTYLMTASNPPCKPLAKCVACAPVCRGTYLMTASIWASPWPSVWLVPVQRYYLPHDSFNLCKPLAKCVACARVCRGTTNLMTVSIPPCKPLPQSVEVLTSWQLQTHPASLWPSV